MNIKESKPNITRLIADENIIKTFTSSIIKTYQNTYQKIYIKIIRFWRKFLKVIQHQSIYNPRYESKRQSTSSKNYIFSKFAVRVIQVFIKGKSVR
jgi:TRAP-type mannitol/chloroaromatic compound transport system substrate-binding protein